MWQNGFLPIVIFLLYAVCLMFLRVAWCFSSGENHQFQAWAILLGPVGTSNLPRSAKCSRKILEKRPIFFFPAKWVWGWRCRNRPAKLPPTGKTQAFRRRWPSRRNCYQSLGKAIWYICRCRARSWTDHCGRRASGSTCTKHRMYG